MLQACTDMHGDEGWTQVRAGTYEGDCRVWYRPHPASAVHSLRISADIDAPLEYLLVLLNEVSLYNTWLPFIGDSKTLSRPARCSQYAWVKVKSPAAVLLHHRDALIHCKAWDGLEEDGRVLVLVRSHVAAQAAQDAQEGTGARPDAGSAAAMACPDGGTRCVRADVKVAALCLEPLLNGGDTRGTRLTAIGNVDPKLDALPPWLLNWLATKFCAVGVWQLARTARRIAGGTDEACPHRQAMRDKADFYDWLHCRVLACTPTISATRYFGGSATGAGFAFSLCRLLRCVLLVCASASRLCCRRVAAERRGDVGVRVERNGHDEMSCGRDGASAHRLPSSALLHATWPRLTIACCPRRPLLKAPVAHRGSLTLTDMSGCLLHSPS